MTGPLDIPHNLIGRRRGLTTGTVNFLTPVTGHNLRLDREVAGKWVRCELFGNGLLIVYPDTAWDFGTGAIDTPDVVRASLAHDMFCHMTHLGLIPWEKRAIADRYYRDLLLQYHCPPFRAWYQWAVVRANSKFNAYWRRDK
jgi:hypothetical protein